MIPLDVLTLFFLTSTLLAMAPGPDNIFVLANSALYGPRAGMAITLGLCTGILGHTTAVALGVAAMFQTSAVAFTTLKSLGVAYLLFLAWRAFRSSAVPIDPRVAHTARLRLLYVQGVVMNITNPKVAIFFLAFLPQFADAARGPLALQMMQLGAVFICAAFLVFSSLAWGAGRLGDWLQGTPRAQVAINRVAGAIFVALAASLALSRH